MTSTGSSPETSRHLPSMFYKATCYIMYKTQHKILDIAYVRVCVCVCIYIYVFIDIDLDIDPDIDIDTHTHASTHTHIYIYLNI